MKVLSEGAPARRILLKLLPVALICALASSCSTLAVAAATVNGSRITEADVDGGVKTLTNDPAFGDAMRSDPTVTRGDGRRQVLTDLIWGAVADQEAKRHRITIKAADEDLLIRQAAQGQGM